MARYLITPTLHDSWRFYHLLDSKTKQDFLNTLNKVKVEPTEAILEGRRFEDNVLAACTDQDLVARIAKEDAKYAACVEEVAAIVRGGLWQERVMMTIDVSGTQFLLYGKTDVMKKDWIYDVKYSQSYELGKYTESIQHALYMACSGIDKFAYLISDGAAVWREDYFFSPEMAQRLRGELVTMIEGIWSDPEFRQAYMTNWQSYDDKKEAA